MVNVVGALSQFYQKKHLLKILPLKNIWHEFQRKSTFMWNNSSNLCTEICLREAFEKVQHFFWPVWIVLNLCGFWCWVFAWFGWCRAFGWEIFDFGLETWAERSLSFKFGWTLMSNGWAMLDLADTEICWEDARKSNLS